jgi:hypothetical protein
MMESVSNSAREGEDEPPDGFGEVTLEDLTEMERRRIAFWGETMPDPSIGLPDDLQ